MKLRLIAGLMLAAAGPLAAAEISDPATVAHLRAVHEALGAASRAITACANDGGDRRECLCRHQGLVRELHATVKTLVSKHQEIAEHSTVRFRNAKGEWIAQNIPALVRQAENPHQCP